MTEIRRIAIFVDEPDPGLFYWVLIENDEDAEIWTDLEAAEEPKTTWRSAFDAGSVAPPSFKRFAAQHAVKLAREKQGRYST